MILIGPFKLAIPRGLAAGRFIFYLDYNIYFNLDNSKLCPHPFGGKNNFLIKNRLRFQRFIPKIRRVISLSFKRFLVFSLLEI